MADIQLSCPSPGSNSGGMNSVMLLALGLAVGVGLAFLMSRGGSVAGMVQNDEIWNWVDYRGRFRSFSIHRDVRSMPLAAMQEGGPYGGVGADDGEFRARARALA